MPSFTRRQLVLLVMLTAIWGLNWPVMKHGLANFPPLTFRAASLVICLAVVGLVMKVQKISFHVPREYWGTVLKLAIPNVIIWHCLMILAIPNLSSGRAAILAYTMPIFSAIVGSVVFKDRLASRAWIGVGAAALGVVLLLWHEVGALGSKPFGMMLMLTSALSWAVGTQLLRRTQLPVPLLTLSFWMIALASVVLVIVAAVFEHERWTMPDGAATFGILYNAILALGFAQITWFFLARSLPPVASTLSVMLIPVIGVFSGSLLLGEVLHWQDWTAVGLMMVAIASVLMPARKT
ncbi:DMT family transporter [Diaphorobacter aerolatus]|uniref:DMT family transporter n=1 Tax=Diaphorobacter aerolatus TaxID=1288495 RepID=A0A7H0GGQ9_9BURK|nr:DMT family transporter [Diaphorobacter aerolatus]QNP47475.1 DMT family transporter [Diaphorobacter aerolatus]